MKNIKEVVKSAGEKITIDNFIEMHNCLKEINDFEKQNKYKDDFKELIQLIIDYLIFGDKKKEQIYFDSFCELDFMKEFIVASKSKNMEILLQIIKSMSALILTITNKASLFFIFSNNFINNIITNDDIQESGEDFLSFYVNFLKSLSLKIDSTTIQLFFQKEKNSFPLLENALKLYNHEDSMIKNVVRNIFLKFAGLSKEYSPLKEYLMSLPTIKYFCFLSCRLVDMTLEINYLAGYNVLYNYNVNPDFEFNYEKLKGIHDDLIDEILYLNDILSLNDTDISFTMLNSLLYYYICPLLLGSILNYKYFTYKENQNRNVKYLVAPEIAIYMLTLFLSNIHNDSLLNILCTLLFRHRINKELIEKFVDVQFKQEFPVFPSNYLYYYKDQNNKEKNLTFVEYITYNFDKKFICNLITKPSNKYYEITQLNKKYEKKFDDSNFDPYNNYEEIFKDVNIYFSKKDKKFMRDYHNSISEATGMKSGLSESENENNVLKYLNDNKNKMFNPIKKVLLEDIFKCGFEIINMGINLLLYSMYYNILRDENNDMNKSLSRKLMYYECNLLPYDLFVNKEIENKTINKNEVDKENENLKDINNDEKPENFENIDNEEDEEKNNNIISTNNEENKINEINNKKENSKNKISIKINNKNILLFKTEIFEFKYKEKPNIYSKDFLIDNKVINNLIKLIKYSSPYCSLEFLLNIYNIKYLTSPITKDDDNIDNFNNEEENEKKEDLFSKQILFNQEQKIKLLDILSEIIQKIKYFIINNISFKYISFESFEKAWDIYQKDYKFNEKNLIIKYILTPYYICIPSAVINVEDFPFQSNNSKYFLDIYLLGFLALRDLLINTISKEFPLENGNYEHKIGDKINIQNLNIHSRKYALFKVLLKKNKKDEFEEYILFVNKNNLIFGIEEKNEETGEAFIKVKSMHPLRDIEICFDKSFTNSLQIYFKTNNYIIECESNERRKQVKAELELKRNEFRKWELNNLFRFLEEEEKKYKELGDKLRYEFYFKAKKEKDGEESQNEKEELFNWE